MFTRFVCFAGYFALSFAISGISWALAQDASYPHEEAPMIVQLFQNGLTTIVNALSQILFFEILGFPFLVLWLVCGGVFFTLRLGFVNLRLFGHGIKVAMGRYSKPDDPGEVTPFASLSAAVSGTVGLGNIAGVAVAVVAGGPGAVVWMMVAGFLGMSTKFAEVTLGHKYRKIDAEGKVSGGAFYYLRDGLADLHLPTLGKWLALAFAFLCLCAAFGGGNMFQANQTVSIMTSSFAWLENTSWQLSLIMAVTVGVVLIGGVKRIAQVAEAVVPSMALIYLIGGMIVLAANAEHLESALKIMFHAAFDFNAIGGGILGVIVNGFQRAVFSNEAGVGSSPIVMAATKSRYPAQVGTVAIIEPFIDTLVICFMTGLIIVVSGVYETAEGNGVIVTATAFASVVPWFPKVLSICVALFAFSTIITWSYYGERAWNYLIGSKTIRLYHILFCLAVFLGGAMQDGQNKGLELIIAFSDLALLSLALPNLIGLYLLSGVVSRELKLYRHQNT